MTTFVNPIKVKTDILKSQAKKTGKKYKTHYDIIS